MTSKAEGVAQKKKVVILGGGVGAMTTAFELTSPSDWQERYESITVYQLGWRLGGKGASGRNMDPAYHYRIEEHGLHIWTGLYDNAFRIIRECYQELGRPPDAPLATWQDAFKPHNFLVLQEVYQGEVFNWTLTLPTNDQLPGEPNAQPLLPLHSYVGEVIQIMRRLFRGSGLHLASDEWVDFTSREVKGLIKRLVGDLGEALTYGERLLLAAEKAAEAFEKELILFILEEFMHLLWRWVHHRIDHAKSRQYWIYLNFAYGNLRGVLESDILSQGFDVVDEQDYRAWLSQYIVDDNQLTIKSPLAWFLYDADFAFKNGDLNQPNLSASAALYSLIRLALTCKGAVIWKMQAGMGDTVFGPLYQVLKRRGVKFEFFHRVKELKLSHDKQSIASIIIDRQANLKGKHGSYIMPFGYNPLVTIKGLDCWPSTPLYEQLEHGEQLKKEGVDFEAFNCKRVVEQIELQAGQDFDQVVLGISLGALPYICCDLIKNNSKWQQMVDNVKTVRTQALQLWLKPTDYQLGWRLGGQPILDLHHVTPLTTWADMTHLLKREGWPARGGRYPLNIAYFCGPMKDEEAIPVTDCGPKQDAKGLSQKRGNQQARNTAFDYIQNYLKRLFPNAFARGEHFKWELLVDDRTGHHQGEAHLDSQYIRGNVQPSERYVMSVSGSTRYRLEPGNSGFDNLYLAGDWTQNAFNSGCVEAAAISGMLASNAMSGYPKREQIVGLTFGHPGTNQKAEQA